MSATRLSFGTSRRRPCRRRRAMPFGRRPTATAADDASAWPARGRGRAAGVAGAADVGGSSPACGARRRRRADRQRHATAATSTRAPTGAPTRSASASVGLARSPASAAERAHGRRLDRRGGADGDEPLALARARRRPRPRARRGRGRRPTGSGRRALGQRALDHRRRARRGTAGRGHARLRRRLGQVRPQLRLVALARERHVAGERVVEDAAERVDVGARVDALAADLLRRDVVERADPVARASSRRRRERVLGEPEVGQVDVVRRGRAGRWRA